MLEKPAVPDETISACLRTAFGLVVAGLAFLPLGADAGTAVYRAAGADGAAYFVKLRAHARFHEVSVRLPRFLSEQGVTQVIPPLAALDGRPWASLGDFNLILYPFVEGCDGYQAEMSERRWHELGAALRRIHSLAAPPDLRRQLPVERYAHHNRAAVMTFLDAAERPAASDALARQCAAFLDSRRAEVLALVARAERLAHTLQAMPPEGVLCHSDLHAGNVLLTPDDRLYIVDWDEPILAPKERDLMYPGGGQGFRGHTPEDEERLFYAGYGPAEINQAALAYYRCERIVADIAAFCEAIFFGAPGGADRAQALTYLQANFLPGNTIDRAYHVDPTRS